MQIQVNTSNGLENKDTLERWADGEIRQCLSRFAGEVHARGSPSQRREPHRQRRRRQALRDGGPPRPPSAAGRHAARAQHGRSFPRRIRQAQACARQHARTALWPPATAVDSQGWRHRRRIALPACSTVRCIDWLGARGLTFFARHAHAVAFERVSIEWNSIPARPCVCCSCLAACSGPPWPAACEARSSSAAPRPRKPRCRSRSTSTCAATRRTRRISGLPQAGDSQRGRVDREPSTGRGTGAADREGRDGPEGLRLRAPRRDRSGGRNGRFPQQRPAAAQHPRDAEAQRRRSTARSRRAGRSR